MFGLTEGEPKTVLTHFAKGDKGEQCGIKAMLVLPKMLKVKKFGRGARRLSCQLSGISASCPSAAFVEHSPPRSDKRRSCFHHVCRQHSYINDTVS